METPPLCRRGTARFDLSLSGTIRPAFGRGALDGAGGVPGYAGAARMRELALKAVAYWSHAPSSLGLRWDRDEGDVTGALSAMHRTSQATTRGGRKPSFFFSMTLASRCTS